MMGRCPGPIISRTRHLAVERPYKMSNDILSAAAEKVVDQLVTLCRVRRGLTAVMPSKRVANGVAQRMF
jgi:hypothetical protein